MDGARRHRAAIRLGLTHVPCILLPSQAPDPQEIHLASSNLTRPLASHDRALALRRILDSANSNEADDPPSQNEIARRLGIPASTTSALLALASLPAPIIDLLRTRRLSPSHAAQLTRLQHLPADQLALAHRAARPLRRSDTTPTHPSSTGPNPLDSRLREHESDSPLPPITSSPCLPVTPSPSPPTTQSPCPPIIPASRYGLSVLALRDTIDAILNIHRPSPDPTPTQSLATTLDTAIHLARSLQPDAIPPSTRAAIYTLIDTIQSLSET